MNPLLRHRVLQHLPLKLLRDPNPTDIRTWLHGKLRVFRRIRIAAIVCIPFTIAFYLWAREVRAPNEALATFDEVVNIFMVAMPALIALGSYSLERQYKLSDEEIQSALDEFKQQQPA